MKILNFVNFTKRRNWIVQCTIYLKNVSWTTATDECCQQPSNSVKLYGNLFSECKNKNKIGELRKTVDLGKIRLHGLKCEKNWFQWEKVGRWVRDCEIFIFNSHTSIFVLKCRFIVSTFPSTFRWMGHRWWILMILMSPMFAFFHQLCATMCKVQRTLHQAVTRCNRKKNCQKISNDI